MPNAPAGEPAPTTTQVQSACSRVNIIAFLTLAVKLQLVFFWAETKTRQTVDMKAPRQTCEQDTVAGATVAVPRGCATEVHGQAAAESFANPH